MSKFMLEAPLHHCYLVSATHVQTCVDTLKDKLKELAVDEDLALSIESTTIDTLNIELARELRQRGQQKGVGETRCLIYGFDAITVEAQNALLKIIENPAEGTHFFFATPIVGDLLETVRSRSWILSGLCSSPDYSAAEDIVEDFLGARGMAERLKVIDKVDTKEDLRMVIETLASHHVVRDNSRLGQALELAADYSRDSGASVKIMRQYLAVAASSPTSK